MPAPLPLITPAPAPAAAPAPATTATLIELVERQQVTTISVIASSTPSGVDTGSNTTEKKGFPVTVAIPALVGGMAAAFGAFGLWWWCSKRNKRQRRERWEAAQRKKQRQRANSGRPSISSSRVPSATNLKNLAEKDVIPPVPALPKHYPRQGEKQPSYSHEPRQQQQSQQYGYGGNHVQQQQQDPWQSSHQQHTPAQYPHGYATQPTIDGPISPTYSDHSTASGSGSSASTASGSGSADSSTPLKEKKTSPTKTGSRSVARVAVADSAAATAGLDANVRYQPKKPSPLALKAQKEKEEQGRQEMLADPSQQNGGQAGGRNVMSGEWGVALGSPNHDPAFSFQDQQSQYLATNQQGSNVSRYSNDPYLSAHQPRAPSGHYSNDPYAGYHDPVNNAAGSQRSNWV